ncbi:hypothetical protein CYMTET_51988, partial [Cymbomonas tetramitiformis]
THFRYGTIKWTTTNVENQAEFELKAAFRKDYNWGAFYKEKWRDTSTSEEWRSALAIEPNLLPCGDDTLSNADIQCFEDDSISYAHNYEILFLTGMGLESHDLVPNNDTLDYYVYDLNSNGQADTTKGKIVNAAADAENTGGKICQCRFHKGVIAGDQACPEVIAVNGDVTDTGYGTASGFGITEPKYKNGAISTDDATELIQTCSPWSITFGFFYGDGAFNNEGVVFKITEINHEDNLVGHFFRGTSHTFTHTYPAASSDGTGVVYTAFFTGGNRISTLNNNANGRYRLEANIVFNPNFPDNKSPISSQIPLLPVPYTAYPGAKFQVPAYDPDREDSVRWFLGTQVEMGGLLASPSSQGTHTWHKDVYHHEICIEGSGPEAVCKDSVKSGLTSTQLSSYTQYYEPFNGEWDDAVNLPNQPPNIAINDLDGIVEWRTGINPTTADSQGFGPLETGFYNLVVMVEEQHPGDTDIQGIRESIAYDTNGRATAVKVPIDFLLYLYPPMHYCNKDCDNSPTGNILKTFESTDGLYGDSEVGGSYPLSGTGQCKICGGGGEYIVSNQSSDPSPLQDVLYYTDSYNNGSVYCNVRPIETNGPVEFNYTSENVPDTYVEYGVVEDPDFVRPPAAGYDFQGCLGAGQKSDTTTIVPYSGIYDVCNINQAPYFLTSQTTPSGVTPELSKNNLPFDTAYLTFNQGQEAFFTLQAYDPDTCVEIVLSETGLLENMALSDPVRITDLEVDSSKTVQRTFTWPAYHLNKTTDTITPTDDAILDSRETYSVTCFFVTDKYLLTSNLFQCVEIELLAPAEIQWCDETPDSGKVYDTYLGVPIVIPLCVKRSLTNTFNYNVNVREVYTEVEGVYPVGAGFSYPYDEINFPPNTFFNATQDPEALQDPFTRDFVFIPEVGQECSYTVCFEGIDMSTVPGTPEVPEEVTDVRCYKMEVYNRVLSFDDSDDIAEVSGEFLSQKINPQLGYSMSAWVMPTCGNTEDGPVNETLVMFLSHRDFPAEGGEVHKDQGLEVRSSIRWHEETNGTGYFMYYDYNSGDTATPLHYQCDIWHYVAVTVDGNSDAVLYVDGALQGFDLDQYLDPQKADQIHFKTYSRPDGGLDNDNMGTFRIGEGYHGYIDEIRVWDYALNVSQVDQDMFTRSLTMEDGPPGAIMELTMQPTSVPDVLSASVEDPSMAYTGMTPCVLGLEHTVGPAVGDCTIAVYGWSFCKSTGLLCSFDGLEVRATYVSPTQIVCVTPGEVSPKFALVKASNDGAKSTDTKLVGKEVTHLYMDSVLFADGTDETGAAADSVCEDLVDASQVTFGGWFCPKCGPIS